MGTKFAELITQFGVPSGSVYFCLAALSACFCVCSAFAALGHQNEPKDIKPLKKYQSVGNRKQCSSCEVKKNWKGKITKEKETFSYFF